MRLAPLLLAAAALAIGDLIALRGAGPARVSPLVFLVAALAALLLAARLYGPKGRATASRIGLTAIVLSIGACLAAGLALGRAASEASLASCANQLVSGDSVRATGKLVSPGSVHAAFEIRPGSGDASGGSPGLRTRLRRVDLHDDQGRCSLPLLTILIQRVEPGWEGSGTRRVELYGVWRRYGDPESSGPRPPGRYGYLRGTLRAADEAALADATVDHAALRRAGRGVGVLEALRSAAAGRLRERIPADVRGIAIAMLLADRSEVSPLWSRRFAESGLAHLLAISGLHVGILAAMCTGLFGLVGATRYRYALGATVIAVYVVAIGAPPAAMRAGLIFGLYAIARERGSPRQFGDMVGVAAIVALVADPLVLLEPGFQLSFAGFMGVAVGSASANRIGRLLPRDAAGRQPSRAAIQFAVVGTAAFLATAPFAALHFQRAAPIAIVSSWVGTPLVALALPALIGAVVLPGPPGALSADAATALLRLLAWAVDLFAGLPFGHGSAAPPRAEHWAALALVGLAASSFAAGRRTGSAAWPAVAAIAVWLAGPAVGQQALRGRTLVCSLAVGQGDAAAIRTRRGNWLLLDAGPSSGLRAPLLKFFRDHRVAGIELLSISHAHLDHMAAVPAILDKYRVGRVLDAGQPLGSERYADFLDGVRSEGSEWLMGRSGAELRVDEVRIQVLGPSAGSGLEDGPRYVDANESSLSLRIAVGRFIYLTTGDAPASEEAAMLARWPADRLRADVLKLGHHGSRTSSSVAWLNAVRPAVAVISAGRRNRHGHPHPETLARLDSAGVERVWRTDLQGTLCIEIDRAGGWKVRPTS